MEPKARKIILLMLGLSLVMVAAGVFRLNSMRATQGIVPPCMVIAPPWHHHYQPDCQGEFKVDGNKSVHYQINSAGIRESTPPKEGDNVLVIGDSDVEGHGLEASQTLPQKLQERFSGLRFINGGIRFTGPLYQRLLIRRLLPIYKPRSVVWFFCENDVNDDRLFEALATKRDPKGIPEEFSVEDFRGTDFHLSWLPEFIGNALVRQLRNSSYVKNTNDLVAGVAPGQTHTCAAIQDSLQALIARKIPVTLVYLPLGPSRPFPAEQYSADILLNCLKSLKSEGQFLNLDEPMKSEGGFFFPGDTHVNPAGIAFIVNQLAGLKKFP